MKAKRKSDGKVIEVREWRGASDVVYSEPDMSCFYYASELDFKVEEAEQCISVARLREVLMDMADETRFLVEDVDEIINRVKESI